LPASAQEVEPPPVGLLRGPYLQDLSATAVTVVWVTHALEGDASVVLDGASRFGEIEGVTCEALRDDAPDARCHRIRLTGLTPDSSHAYEIFVGEESLTATRKLSFRTPPRRGEGVAHFAVFGDSGALTAPQFLIADVIRELAPQAILHTGDLDYLADPDRSIFHPYAEILPRMCLFPARGNHDLTYPFPQFFIVPGESPGIERTFFSFDQGPAHIVVVDSTIDSATEEGETQLTFLREDLAAARSGDLEWIVVVLHEPVFTVGPHAANVENVERRNLFTPIFDEFDVDLVLNGDDHLFHRSKPLTITDELCPDLDVRDCEEGGIPFCYEIVDAEQGPHYASPGGTIYVVSGGGGQRLYAVYNPQDIECRFVDQAFTEVVISQFHTVELRISEPMLEARTWNLLGERIDTFSIQKIRALRGDVDLDDVLSLADAIGILGGLFLGRPVDCPQVGNVDGGASVDVADAIYLLSFLFLGGPPPAPPFPECGLLEEGTPDFCSRDGC
jgi:hypothetical protein